MRKILENSRYLHFVLTAVLMFGLFCTNVNFAQASESTDAVVVSIDLNNKLENDNIISYKVDHEGNIYGPEDFTIDNEDIYLLDSSDNKVIKFTNGKATYKKLKNKAVKIASKDKNLFTLNNDLSITKYDELGNDYTYDLDKNIFNEAIVDFRAIDKYIYITTTEGNSGKTYKLNLQNNSDIAETMESFEGRIFDENTTYKTELKHEKGKSVGRSGKITIVDIKTGAEKVIPLTSKYWLIGAEYLGVDSKGNYRIKLYEMLTKEDFTVEVEETIRIVKPNGSLIGIKSKEKQKKYISNQNRVFGNDLYELKNLENSVEIIKVSSPDEKSVEKFTSKLKNIVEPSEEIVNPPFQTASTITRSTIMSNAMSYHASFKWSCTSANLAAMTNWTKPRYVGSAGSYQQMPYCWGGFSSPSQYNTGLSNGGRVGNIYTGTGAYVSNTYGVDCSGYVSRAWGLTSKYGTSTIMNVATKINASNLMQGDALNKSGSHIVLFSKYDTSGNYVLYEATTWNSYDRVALTTRTVSSISEYVPIKYNNVSN